MKLLILLAGVCWAQAAEVRVQVLTPFRLTELRVTAATIRVDGETVRLTEPVKLAVREGRVGLRVGSREWSGAQVTALGPVVRLGQRVYRGDVELRVSDGRIVAVVRMDLETAVGSVVAAEMADERGMEALKAQAVVARSYYVGARGRHADGMFCDTTHCQFLKDAPAESPAAQATRGKVLMAGGKVVGAMYFRSCGGRTFAAREVGLGDEGYPYFPVKCEACARAPRKWEYRLDAKDVPSGRSEMARLELARRFGWGSVRSNDFVVEGGVLMGKGEGHGVGLCQRGAAGMAQAGHDYLSILRHYLPGTNVVE